jgi:hypothetical protein
VENYLYDYPTTDQDTAVNPGDPSHVVGSQNSGVWHRKIGQPVYQWLIVVGALGALWMLYFAFRSDIKL